MKTNPDQLSTQLSKTTAPVYFVTGDEPLIIEESCDQIRLHLKNQGFNEREVLHVEAGFKWEYLLECANALSLFADLRLIEIRLNAQKINKQASAIIQEYVKNAPAENVLLIIADKLDASSKKSAWYKAIDNKGLIVEIWPIESHQLPSWLKQRAKQSNLELNDEAVAILCDRLEGNLLAAKQELDKLKLLNQSNKLSAEDIIAAVSDSSRYDVFTLMDAVIAGQSERSLKILQTLKQEGVEATIILWAITRDIRLLHIIKAGLLQSISYDALCTKNRIWGKRKPIIKHAASRHTVTNLELMLRHCAQADQIIKGMSDGDSWLIITDMILNLSGKKLSLLPL